MKFASKLHQIWKDHDLRHNILYVVGLLVVFRIAAQIPMPGIDIEAIKNLFSNNELLGFLNVFSGGAMSNFSIVALGIGPYITASIIFQLLTMIVPAFEEMAKEGESGQKKINQYTRLLAVPLAFLQGFSMIKLLQQSGVIVELSTPQYLSIITILTAGTIFLMWLGELISEKKVGNGISLIIFAGIVSGLPRGITKAWVDISTNAGQLTGYLSFIVIILLTVAGIVILTEGQRNIPVSYAKRVRGNRMYGGFDTHLPLKVNQAGMIPIIFAVSLLIFPTFLARLFVNASSAFIRNSSQFIISLFDPSGFFYALIYFLLVFGFTYFYTAVIFHPHKIADNLQKQGGFVPGIRPGRQTADYLGKVSSRIMLAGALSLGIIAILPLIIAPITNIGTIAISGASLLIVVSVVLETIRQVDSQLVMREYEGL